MLSNPGILAMGLVPACSSERERHAAFLRDKLVLAFATLAVAPLFLAVRGAPTPAESLLFAAMLVTGAAALVVARTGRLVLGHAITATGLATVAAILFVGLGAGAGAALAWLGAAVLETAASLDTRLRRLGGLLIGAAALASVVAAFDPRLAPTSGAGTAAILTALAATVAAPTLWRLCASLRHLEAAAAARAMREQAIDATQDRVILDLDATGAVHALSRRPGSFLTAADDMLLGRGLFDHVHIADRPAFLKLVDDAAHAGETVVGRFRLRVDAADAQGTPCHLSLEMRAHRSSTCEGPSEVVAVLEDVSDRHVQARELETSRRAVAEALRAKDQFMTTMSHELRTPLNAIIGFSEMLASRTTRPEDVTKQCEYARTINQSGQHLLQVVNAVLDVSRLQSGIYPIQPEPFDVTALLDQAVEAVAARAREGAIKLQRDYPTALEEVVGDRRALKAALVALLANAIKFTPARGEVTLRAHPEGTALVVAVSDTGFGIAAEDLARLGQPFFQAGGNLTRPFDGAGLGLALVRGVVGLHGGGIAIDSDAGLGTTVTLRLPLDCRVIAHRSADLEIETTRRLRRVPTLVKDAA